MLVRYKRASSFANLFSNVWQIVFSQGLWTTNNLASVCIYSVFNRERQSANLRNEIYEGNVVFTEVYLEDFFFRLSFWCCSVQVFWGLKQQRRRRLRKCHSKSDVALPQTLSRLFHVALFVVGNFFFFCSWFLRDCIKVREKKKTVVGLCSRPR